VKSFDWNDEKNEQLKNDRGVSFEEIVFHISQGDLLDIVQHPNQKKYPGQRIFIVNVENYACLVPFAEDNNSIFLKTIIPSRKMTRISLGGSSK
jgi:uncharacterized DUF497 family protein